MCIIDKIVCRASRQGNVIQRRRLEGWGGDTIGDRAVGECREYAKVDFMYAAERMRHTPKEERMELILWRHEMKTGMRC